MCVYTPIYTYTHIYIYIYGCAHKYIHGYTWIYMYVYTQSVKLVPLFSSNCLLQISFLYRLRLEKVFIISSILYRHLPIYHTLISWTQTPVGDEEDWTLHNLFSDRVKLRVYNMVDSLFTLWTERAKTITVLFI